MRDDARSALSWLEKRSTRKNRENLARFGITAGKSYGVSMAGIQTLARRLGRSHELAAALWKTGWYEARLLCAFVEEPERVTPAQMDAWCRDFDNWAICDTLCFHLFDRTPYAWSKVTKWCERRDEFGRRAGFALLACLALHDKTSPDSKFAACLPAIERGAADERNFVKKAASWALRSIGRRGPGLRAKATALAHRLAASSSRPARWVGKDALRDLSRPPRRS